MLSPSYVAPVTLVQDSRIVGSYPRGGTNVGQARRSGPLAANSTETVLDVADPIIIDALSMGCNHKLECQLFIDLRDKDGTLINLVRPHENGGGTAPNLGPGMFALAGAGNTWNGFELVVNDESGDRYVVNLTRPIYAPFGARIRAVNASTTTERNIALTVWYREMKL